VIANTTSASFSSWSANAMQYGLTAFSNLNRSVTIDSLSSPNSCVKSTHCSSSSFRSSSRRHRNERSDLVGLRKTTEASFARFSFEKVASSTALLGPTMVRFGCRDRWHLSLPCRIHQLSLALMGEKIMKESGRRSERCRIQVLC